MKTRLPKKYSPELIRKFYTFFDVYEKGYDNWYFEIDNWIEIYKGLVEIFIEYIVINDNPDIKFFDSSIYSGGFVRLNTIYKEKYVKDVSVICLENAYPQRINQLCLMGMKSNDGYFPYIFNIVYQHMKSKDNEIDLTCIKNFINFTYGLLTIRRDKYFKDLPIVDKDLRKEVSLYYSNILNSIDKKLYYYIDTDEIYTKADNIEKICKILENNHIKYSIERKSNFLFLDRKKYIEIKDRKIINVRGLK
jgi:hypothetical protein